MSVTKVQVGFIEGAVNTDNLTSDVLSRIATGGTTDKIFYESDVTVTSDYTVATNRNSKATGPLVLGTGVTITIPDGSRLVVE